MFPTVEVTFSPGWWKARYGLETPEAVWRDPVRRTECERETRRLLHDAFGDVGLGERDPEPRPNVEAYGHRFLAAYWGCEIRYPASQAPSAVPLADAADVLRRGRAPDPGESVILERALDEARLLERRYGVCDRAINLGGPLNNAVSVFGEEILAVLAADPAAGRRALEAMRRALLDVYDQLTLGRSGPTSRRHRGCVCLGNCPVCMVSPRTYTEVVLPVDLAYRRAFPRFELHHCGAVESYARSYARLGASVVDVGWTSDRVAVRRLLPDTPLSLMVEASALAGLDAARAVALIAATAAEASPLHRVTKIWVAEIGTEVSDDVVRALVTLPGRRGPPAD